MFFTSSNSPGMFSRFAAINARSGTNHELPRVRCRRNVTPETASGLDRLDAGETNNYD